MQLPGERSNRDTLAGRRRETGHFGEGPGLFLLSFGTTAQMHIRFKTKLLGDVDQPVLAN